MESYARHVHIVPGVQGGFPVIRGTRTPVRTIVQHFYVTYPGDKGAIRQALPHLTEEQINAALAFYSDNPRRIDEDIEQQRIALNELLAST
jgi:uncharacterized protein (DUF433 family)